MQRMPGPSSWCQNALVVALAAVVALCDGAGRSSADNGNGGAPGAITVQPNLGVINLEGGQMFAPDGKYIAIGNRDQIKLWDTASGRPLRVLEYPAFFEQFTYIGYGAQILSMHMDGKLRTWDPATGQMLSETPVSGIETETRISAMSYHPAQESVVIVGGDPIVVYGNRSVRASLKFDAAGGDDAKSAEDAALSDDGRVLIAAGSGLVKRFEVASGRQTDALALRSDLSVLPSGTLGAGVVVTKTAAEDCAADIVLAILTGKEVRYAPLDTAPGCPETSDTTQDDHGSAGEIRLARNEAKGLLYVSRRGGKSTKVVDLNALQQSSTAAPTIGEVDGQVVAVDQSGTLAAIEDGDALRIVRLADGSLVSRMVGHNQGGMFPVASADGRQMMLIKDKRGETEFSVLPIDGVTPVFSRVRLPSGYIARHAVPDANVMLADDEHGRFIVLSTLTGEQISSFTTPSLDAIGTNIGRLSPDVRHAMLDVRLGAKSDMDEGEPAVLLVKTRTGEIEHEFRGRSAGSFAFSADGRFFALGWYGGSVELWSVEPARLVKELDAAIDTTISLTFSPDNRLLIGGGRDAGIFVWSLETGKVLHNLEPDFDYVAGHVSIGGAAISQDSELVAAGPRQRAFSSGDIGRERRVQVWDLATGKLRFLLSGHEANVNALAFTEDRRWLVSGSNDGTVRYWHRDTGKLGATFAVADGRWAIVTDQGFFAASSNAGDLLSVVRGFEAVSIEQLWQSLYAPDLVREFLAGDPGGEVARGADNADLQSILESGPAPDVAIVRPATGEVATDDLIEVGARIRDRGKGIGRIEWRVNGTTAGVETPPAGTGGSVTVKRELALDPGENTIEVVAYNGRNLLASLPARATVTWRGTAEAGKGRLFVLAIGIDAYSDARFAGLTLAVKDAEKLGAALEAAGKDEYATVQVFDALNSDASLDKLDAKIDEVAREITPRDTFILFAAAHGTSENGRFYLIPYGYSSETPGKLADKAIGQDKLQDWLANRIRAKKALILLDTCESGALVGGHIKSRSDAPASEAAVGRLHEATGRPVLTAAAAGQAAREGFKGHGIFTWAVLDALKNGDADANGTIELSELAAHVQDLVPQIRVDERDGVVKIMRGIIPVDSPEGADRAPSRQSARFGSRGENFVVAKRLAAPPERPGAQ